MSICDNVSRRFFFYKTPEPFLLFCFAATKLLRVAVLVTVGFAVADRGPSRAARLALDMSVVPSRPTSAVVAAAASLASLRRTLSVLDVEVAEACSDCLWNFNKTKLCKHVVSDLGLLSQTHTLSEHLHAFFFFFFLLIIALD